MTDFSVDWDIGDYPAFYQKRMEQLEKLAEKIEALREQMVDDYSQLCDFASEQITEAFKDDSLVSVDLSAGGIVLRLGDIDSAVTQLIPWSQIGMTGPGIEQLADKLERFAAHIRQGIRKGGDIDDFPLAP